MSENNGKSGTKHTLIEAGSVFKGSLESTCSIVVLGKLEGEVVSPSIEIQEGGQVSGRVKVTELSSRGELAGNVEAEQVELGGRVQNGSVIRARSLQVKLDAAAAAQGVLFGDCELNVGDELAKEAVISEAAASRRAPAAPEPAAPPPLPEKRPPEPPPLAASTEAAAAPVAPSDGMPPADSGAPTGRRRRNTAATHIEVEPTTTVK
jgi:cytoskeletal protein CcmA (bactofilin family)